MKRFVSFSLVVLATLALVRPGAAQQPGDAGIFAKLGPGLYETTLDVLPNLPYNVSAVAFDLEGGLFGFEVGLDGVPVGTFALSTVLAGPGPLNVGDVATWNYIVGTGGCVEQAGAIELVTWQFLSTIAPAPDTWLSLRGTSPSDLGGDPGYLRCDTSQQLFGIAGVGALVLNATAPPTLPGLPVRVDLGDVEGEASDVITVPVDLGLSLARTADPSRLAGIDLEIAFDSAVVELDSVRLGTSNADWLVQFNPQAGTADISAAGTTPVDIPSSGETLLLLDFRATTLEGFTTVDVLSSRLFDLDQQALPDTASSGQIIVNCDKGDPVEDDEVNSADAIRTLSIAVGLFSPTPLQFCAADMDRDDAITVGDATLVLRAAVGLFDPEAAREASNPSVFVSAGRRPGEMLVAYDDAAGLDLEISYDPERVRFQSAVRVSGEPLVLPNDTVPGRLRVGAAAVENGPTVLSLQFEELVPGSTVLLEGITAFDTLAQSTSIPIVDPKFDFGVTGIDGAPNVGRAVEFLGAQPNPFNPRTQIRYRVMTQGDVRIGIYDVAGRQVREIVQRAATAGEHSLVWDGTDDAGSRVASGVYNVVVDMAGESARGRVTLLK